MALIQATIMSQSLMRTVPVNVIIPADKLRFPGMPERGENRTKRSICCMAYLEAALTGYLGRIFKDGQRKRIWQS